MEYKILSTRTFPELETAVNAFLKEGWRPLGGIADTNACCSQAIVRDIPQTP